MSNENKWLNDKRSQPTEWEEGVAVLEECRLSGVRHDNVEVGPPVISIKDIGMFPEIWLE